MNESNSGDPQKNSQRIRLFFSFLTTLVLLGLLARRGALLHTVDTLVLGLGLLNIVLLTHLLFKSRKTVFEPPSGFPPADLCIVLFLVLYLSTGAAANNWFFFPRWSISYKGILSSWLLRSLVITLLLSPLLLCKPRSLKTGVFVSFALLTLLACGFYLEKETGFRPLYRVDHPSFFYRYAAFMETFPRPDFYDPNWNGGHPVPYLVASGTWSLAVIWVPLMKIFTLRQLYTPMIAVTFLLLIPWSGYAAARFLGGNRRAGWIAFLLFMVPGQRYFTHVLHYGTAPSIFCLCLFPLILALFWRLLHAETLRRLACTTVLLTAASALALCWPGSLLPGIPLLLALLSVSQNLTPRRLLWMCISAGILILLLHPLALVPIRHSPIDRFIQVHETRNVLEIWDSGLQRLSGLLQGIHPVIVIFAVTVGFIDPNRIRGHYLGTFIFSSVLLAGWGEEFSPLLQWERLIIPAAMTGAVAAGIGIDRLIRGHESLSAGKTAPLSAVGLAWTLSLLILGGYQGIKIYGNDGQMDFQTLPAHTKDLVHWLKNEVPEDGRILIAGKAVHGYGGAKVAAMPLLTGREMLACDFYGFSPKLVEYQYPPKQVRAQGPDGVFRFLDLYNVTHVMTYHQNWKEALERHPDRYRPVYGNGRVQVYAVNRGNSLFLEGQGTVDADFRRIKVELPPGQDRVVLKYNWSEYLRTDGPAELFPVEQEFGIRLIGIRPNGLEQLTLEHRP